MKAGFAIALLLASLMAGMTASAQTQAPSAPATMDAIRQAVGADKRALVEKNMQLTPEEAKKFWPIYDEYQKELEKIVQKQNRAVLDYVNAENSMTDANARRIAKELVGADSDENKLREKTARKMLTALPARKAVRYLQIENKLRAFYRYDIAERIPLVK